MKYGMLYKLGVQGDDRDREETSKTVTNAWTEMDKNLTNLKLNMLVE